MPTTDRCRECRRTGGHKLGCSQRTARSYVAEVLASGRYVDRRGREWEVMYCWLDSSPSAVATYWYELRGDRSLTPDQMLRLIERDRHECQGFNGSKLLRDCYYHPVPRVVRHAGALSALAAGDQYRDDEMKDTLAEAFAAAEELSKRFDTSPKRDKKPAEC